MIRTLATVAAEGSPAGDFIRQNDTASGVVCIVLVVVFIGWLLTRSSK